MKCNKCGAEWKQGMASITLAKCPFCGELLIEQQKPDNLTLDVALKQIFADYGIALLQNPNKLIAIFRDTAPQLRKEHKVLEMALNFGIGNYFINCPLEERKKNVNRALQAINFFNDDTKEMVISAFVKALGWNEINIDDLFDKNVKDYNEPKDSEKGSVVEKERIEDVDSDNINVEDVAKVNIDTTLLETNVDADDEGLEYNNENIVDENNQDIIQPVTLIDEDQYHQAKPVIKNDVTKQEKKVTVDNDNNESVRKKHLIFKILLAFFTGACILFFGSGIAFGLYLAIVLVILYNYIRSKASFGELLFVVGILVSLIVGMQHYESGCNRKLYEALDNAISTQERYWKQKDNGEKYLTVRFELMTEFPDMLYPLLPTRKAVKQVLFEVLDNHYRTRYAKHDSNSNPAHNLKYDMYLFKDTVGIVSENATPEARKPYEVLGQRFNYEEYRRTRENGKPIKDNSTAVQKKETDAKVVVKDGNTKVEDARTGIIKGTFINARTGPSLQSDIITTFGVEEKVSIIAELGEWAKVKRYNGTVCYVEKKYLKVIN